MPMVTAITEIGSTIRHTVVEHMSTWMVPNTSATGKRINNTAMVSKLGPTLPNMKAITSSVRSMVSVLSSGLTDQPILVNFITKVLV